MRHFRPTIIRSLVLAMIGAAALDLSPVAALAQTFPCDGYDIVVMAGQSNAVGRGLTGSHTLTSAQIAAEPRVFETVRAYDANGYFNYRYLTPATFAIQQAQDPLMTPNNIHSLAGRIGFTYSFSLFLAANEADPYRCVVIVPSARSGTSVLEWNVRAQKFPGDSKFFYLDMISRTRLALSLLPNARIVAFLWQQGERDTWAIFAHDTGRPDKLLGLMPNARKYYAELSQVIANVREDLGCFPALFGNMAPVYMTRVATNPAVEKIALQTKAKITQQIQKVVAQEPCHDAQFIPSTSLLTNAQEPQVSVDPDYVSTADDYKHFSAASQIILSKRYYDAFKSLQSAKAP